jgi:hypothetical protein
MLRAKHASTFARNIQNYLLLAEILTASFDRHLLFNRGDKSLIRFFLKLTKMDASDGIAPRWSAGTMPQLDSWIHRHGGMPRRLIRPSHTTPGDRLSWIWKAFKAHVHDLVDRGSIDSLDADVEDAYRDAYLEACPTEDDKSVAREEIRYNLQLVTTWCVYTACSDHLDICGWDRDEVKIAKSWMGEQLKALRVKELALREAQTARESRHVDVSTLRIRIPILKKHCLCGQRAKCRFEGNGWSEKMCVPCYERAMSE